MGIGNRDVAIVRDERRGLEVAPRVMGVIGRDRRRGIRAIPLAEAQVGEHRDDGGERLGAYWIRSSPAGIARATTGCGGLCAVRHMAYRPSCEGIVEKAPGDL